MGIIPTTYHNKMSLACTIYLFAFVWFISQHVNSVPIVIEPQLDCGKVEQSLPTTPAQTPEPKVSLCLCRNQVTPVYTFVYCFR